MMLFLVGEIGIILSGLMITFGHIGLASKCLVGTFFLFLFATVIYLIGLINNDKK